MLALQAGMDADLGGVTFPLLVHAVASKKLTEKDVERATCALPPLKCYLESSLNCADV